ncbi:hypothetical protein [Synechococcus sp. M16CYN]|uniref:hypothetical protein n=1 Tax=Synechococcus sp. M16CYN TaxID=3103139 RepID=UPI003342C637
MKFNPEPDVWAPKDGAGYLQLFCFGLFIATIAVGGNIVLKPLDTLFSGLLNNL